MFFPQDAPNDPQNLVGDLLIREKSAFLTPSRWLQFAGGVDVRANTYDQVQWSRRIEFSDRSARRPGWSIRRLSATIAHGPLTIDLGKQFIRWGKTDIVTPTDRFAPRDFLNVIDNEFLAVTGARGVWQAKSDDDRLSGFRGSRRAERRCSINGGRRFRRPPRVSR